MASSYLQSDSSAPLQQIILEQPSQYFGIEVLFELMAQTAIGCPALSLTCFKFTIEG